jgi:hypothetical protein
VRAEKALSLQICCLLFSEWLWLMVRPPRGTWGTILGLRGPITPYGRWRSWRYGLPVAKRERVSLELDSEVLRLLRAHAAESGLSESQTLNRGDRI